MKETQYGTDIEVKVKRMKRENLETRLDGNIVLRVNEKMSKQIEGRGISFYGKLGIPDDPFRLAYLSKKIIAQSQAGHISRLSEFDDPFLMRFSSIKRKVRKLLMSGLPHNAGALHQGIVLGEREELDQSIEEDFRRTGTSHILAVSGENLALLLTFCLLALSAMSISSRAAYLLCIPISIFYAALTGFEPSVMRALIVGIVGLFALFLGRAHLGIDVLSMAAIILLGSNPFLLYNTGFQLSFAAAASLMILTPKIMRLLEFLPWHLSIIISSTVAAQLGVAPILAYQFNQVSLIGFAANLFVLPVVGWILPVGLASIVIGWISPALSSFLNISNLPLLDYLLLNARLLGNIPGAAISVVSPSILLILLYYLVLVIFFNYSNRLKISTFHVLCLIFLSLDLILMLRALPQYPPKDLRVEFFYVGEGDSALVSTPDGKNVLIDGGPERDLVLAKLQKRKIRTIDLMILSHPHADHLNGLVAVARRFRIGSFMTTQGGEGQYGMLVDQLKRDGVQIIVPEAGDCYKIGSELKIKVLLISKEAEELNEKSLVIRICYRGQSFLFPGDAELGLSLINEADLRSEVLKVSHHGSFDEGQIGVFRKISPIIAVISAGKNNRFHHPAQSTVRNLLSVAAKVLRTDRCGDISIDRIGNKLVAQPAGF